MYKVYLLPPAQKDLDNYGGKVFRQIETRILALENDPHPKGSIKLTAEEGYRIRSGEYRIVYRIDDDEKIVHIYRIKHRKNVHKHRP